MNEDYRLLLEELLQDLFSATGQTLDALPSLAEAAATPALAHALDAHLAEAERQIDRLERVADMLEFQAEGTACEAVEGLLAEIEEMLDEQPRGAALDAALLGAVRRLEHHGIAAYATLCALARTAGCEEVASLLGESLGEERAMDELLGVLAEQEVNPAAFRETSP
jgi:ferritin-like metal-binding protein YciE